MLDECKFQLGKEDGREYVGITWYGEQQRSYFVDNDWGEERKLVVAAWQIGIAIAPSVMHWLRSLKREVDEVTADALVDLDQNTVQQQNQKEHTNGTRH